MRAVLEADDQRLIGAPRPGDVLEGKYTIERVLGAGGMGIVFAARHSTLGQRVAVKMLLPEVARRPEAVERFLREARACINLKSEHVARVLDVGTHDNGAPFMVMEYLDGEDLQRAIAGGPLAVAAAIDYTLQAAEALAEAHGMGIVHRDLKPANLFLSGRADGSPLVKVLDFGISKALSAEQGITRTDAIMGSPGYMSPEQINSAKHVDQRTDVWGLGIVLYELLTGRPPFEGEHLAAISVKIVLEKPKPVHELRSDVPRPLSAVVERCLAKDVGERYQNMAELAEALLPFAPKELAPLVERIRRITRQSIPFAATISVDGATVAASGTAGGWESRASAPDRRKLVLGAAGAAIVLAGVLTGVFLLGQRSARDPDAAAERASAPAATTASPPPAASAFASVEPVVTAAVPSTLPSATAVPSATAEPVDSVKKPARRAPAPARPARGPQCPKGQVATNGHCCPAGMVWQQGACDRPLATSLP